MPLKPKLLPSPSGFPTVKQKCKHSSSHTHAGRIILPEGASRGHYGFAQDGADVAALLGFGLLLSYLLPLPTLSVFLACYSQSLNKLPKGSLFTLWGLNQGLDPAWDGLVASPELLFFCFALAQASCRLSGFPPASPSAFISWLPERAQVLMSVLFCLFICSADLYMISLCLLKCFLLSTRSRPAELLPPPVELGHLTPSIPLWCRTWQARHWSRAVTEQPPSAAALVRLRELLFPRPGVRPARCRGPGGVAQRAGPRHSSPCLS